MDTALRKNFGKLTEAIEPPNLLQNQVDSFHDFLQREVPSSHRKQAGLEAVFREVFPIISYDEKSRLEYVAIQLVIQNLLKWTALTRTVHMRHLYKLNCD